MANPYGFAIVAGGSSCAQRSRHLLTHPECPGRHTVSGLIAVLGGQFEDWTANYGDFNRLHEQNQRRHEVG